MQAPLPRNEAARLNALQRYQILDTPPEEIFDDLTRLAAYLCETPTALISFVDSARQWFKSKVCLEAPETSRAVSFCAFAILQPELLIVPDTHQDKRFANNPLVTAEPKIRFYTGMPLITPEGYAIGTLCAIDYVPRELSQKQVEGLRVLARQVITQLELQRNLFALRKSEKALLQAREVLERRVRERTVELAKANKELQNEITVAKRLETQRQRAETQLLHNALHDPLTNLPNRALFMDRLEHAMKRAQRRAARPRSPNQKGTAALYLFAVLYLDLDRFKLVNDSLGHRAGDQLLQAIALRLQGCLRPDDTVARLGGDEFTILLDDIKNVGEAIHVCQRIQEVLRLPFKLGDPSLPALANTTSEEIFTSASIGVAFSSSTPGLFESYDNSQDLLRDADVAMYRAKSLGKARHEVFKTTMHQGAVERLQLETDLRRALERQEFILYYQPIVTLETGKLCGFEALLRWQHPSRGLVSPAEFIPIAEETGLIVPIGQWVLREACQQMLVWHQDAPLTMNVNLSSKQFQAPGLVKQIEQILWETGLDPHCLKLEITENLIMEKAELVTEMLFQLQALGIQLCMDDFGTGYSSLSYLHRFPVSVLKIDRSFISTMDSLPPLLNDGCWKRYPIPRDGSSPQRAAPIVATIIKLAHTLQMDVVAEGIETPGQLHQLKMLGCKYGQGYFFSKPVDGKTAETLLLN